MAAPLACCYWEDRRELWSGRETSTRPRQRDLCMSELQRRWPVRPPSAAVAHFLCISYEPRWPQATVSTREPRSVDEERKVHKVAVVRCVRRDVTCHALYLPNG